MPSFKEIRFKIKESIIQGTEWQWTDGHHKNTYSFKY
jgi:hypothetical protein